MGVALSGQGCLLPTRLLVEDSVYDQVVPMVVGLIDDLPTCAELLERIVRDCRESLRAASVMAAWSKPDMPPITFAPASAASR